MEWKKITKEELKDLIDNNTYTDIGKMFGINGNSIRKKAKRFGIWERENYYNGYNEKLKKFSYCLWCGGIIKKNASDFCSSQCTSNFKYHIYINRWKLGLETGVKVGGNVSNYIKKYLKEKYGDRCSRCGWDTPNPFINKVILEIEHIDGNSTNNKEDNLDQICPNCHSLTGTYKALNKGNGNKDRLRYYGLTK